MTINVITAIRDGEFEAEVANLLYSHGCEISFRALEPIDIANFILKLPSLERWYLVHSEDFLIPKQIKNAFNSQLILVNQESFNPKQVIDQLSENFRPPLKQSIDSISNLNLITVFGSSGGAGTSTIANHIFFRIKQTHTIEAVRDLDQLSKLKVNTLCLAEHSPIRSLNSSFTDRRKPAHFISALVKASAQIAYVIPSSKSGLSHLEIFLKDFKSLNFQKPLSVILNKQFYDSEGRSLLKQFTNMISEFVEQQNSKTRQSISTQTFIVSFNHRAVNRFPTKLNPLSDNFFKQINQISQNWLRLPEQNSGKLWLDDKSFRR